MSQINNGSGGGGGGTTINPTNGVLPVRSSSSAFIDSPFTVSGGNVASSGILTAPSYNLATSAAWCVSLFEASANGSNSIKLCAPSAITVDETYTFPDGLPTNYAPAIVSSTGAITLPDTGTSGQVLTSNGVGVAPTFQPLAGNTYYTIAVGGFVGIPANGSTLYLTHVADIGNGLRPALADAQVLVPVSGTVVGFTIKTLISNPGTSEAITFKAKINSATSIGSCTVSGAVRNASCSTNSIAASNAVVGGTDLVTLEMDAPTWVTPPNNIFVSGYLVIKNT